jgi:hypothetical protein
MMKLPAMHNLSNGSRRLRTDPRIEANEDVSLRAFDLSRSKRIAEEVKLHDWIRSAPVIITAVSDLRFLRMQFQEPGREASLNRIFASFKFRVGSSGSLYRSVAKPWEPKAVGSACAAVAALSLTA